MATQITLTLDDNLTQEQQDKLRNLFCDAFYEFRSHRGPSAEEYVNRRYPNNPEYAWLDREKKIQEVHERRELAEILHSASAVAGGPKVSITKGHEMDCKCNYCTIYKDEHLDTPTGMITGHVMLDNSK